MGFSFCALVAGVTIEMKPLWLIFAIVFALVASSTFGRTWTDTSGKQTQGNFVRYFEGNVILSRGKHVVKIPFAALSEPDQDYVREQLESKGQGDLLPPKPPDNPAGGQKPRENPAGGEWNNRVPVGAGPERTWTSNDGRQILARFMRATADTVVLWFNGREVTLPLTRLSEADQQYVKEELKKQQTGKTPPPRVTVSPDSEWTLWPEKLSPLPTRNIPLKSQGEQRPSQKGEPRKERPTNEPQDEGTPVAKSQPDLPVPPVAPPKTTKSPVPAKAREPECLGAIVGCLVDLFIRAVFATVIGAILLMAACWLYNFAAIKNANVPQPEFGTAAGVAFVCYLVNVGLAFLVGWSSHSGCLPPGTFEAYSHFSLPASFLLFTGLAASALPTTFGRALLVATIHHAIAIGLVGTFVPSFLGAVVGSMPGKGF
ncbi:MAG: hypothetical protein LLG00_13740 [Planctomycetaceae bacterium]|nr:hypothetical protein [Planctomycetaceae bacterium]